MSKHELGDGEPSPPLGTCNYWRDEHVEGSHDMCLGWAKSANNAETLARWIWANFVGIPITEPYDKEYIALHDRIEKLQREWFVEGLSEARRQFGRSGAAQEVLPVGFVSEIRPRPDDPSCHVCGAQMVVKEWKCLSCGATTGCSDGEVSPPSPECESNSITLGAYCKHGNSYCLLCFAESKSHPTQQPVKKFEERSRDLGNERAESGAKTDPEPKGTCSKHVGLHVNIEELCEEWHEEREFDAYCKAVGFWPTDENFKIWKESALRGFASSGPLCDNCSKTSREHYCYFGSSYDEKFSPSERRSGPFSELQIAIDTATKPLHAEIEKLRGDTRELKAAVDNLKAARTAWHEDYGVPVSAKYAEFLEAIGKLTDEAERLLRL